MFQKKLHPYDFRDNNVKTNLNNIIQKYIYSWVNLQQNDSVYATTVRFLSIANYSFKMIFNLFQYSNGTLNHRIASGNQAPAEVYL